MKTKKSLKPKSSIVYRCELEKCPNCGQQLECCDYHSGRKIVQTMESVLQVAYHPKRCPMPDCSRNQNPFVSAQWLHLSPRHGTYGFDVLATIGWQRQNGRQIFRDIHSQLLQANVQISESNIRYLYHEQYLPLLASHERQHLGQLEEASRKTGLILTLDGLAPEGGEPQLWLVRELTTSLTLRSGWMSEQSAVAFENFLAPIAKLGLNVKAVLSDKQRGLVPAIKTIFPNSLHGLCQAHFLGNVAKPIAETDEKMKVELRKAVRHELKDLLKQEKTQEPGVLTVTGLLPSKLPDLSQSQKLREANSPLIAESKRENEKSLIEDRRQNIVDELKRRVRYLLTLKGRPPFRLAGLEMFERLQEIVEVLESMLNHTKNAELQRLHDGVKKALTSIESKQEILKLAAGWLQEISTILEPKEEAIRTGSEVKEEFFTYLGKLVGQSSVPKQLDWAEHIRKTTVSHGDSLFHTYDVPELPRTNNERESEFRDLRRQLLRTTGQKGATKRALQRTGAWELIPRPETLQATTTLLSSVDFTSFQEERERMRLHRSRFRGHTRSGRLAQKQLQQLKEQWLQFPTDASL